MQSVNGQAEIGNGVFSAANSVESLSFLEQLFADAEDVVLQFLAGRPIQTVAMAGFIRDNGIVSRHNRGTFYGYWNSRHELEGVALIGHATLFEAKTHAAVRAFAEFAKTRSDIHIIMAEQPSVREFLKQYSKGGQTVRHSCEQILFETSQVLQQQGVSQLRRATVNDLHLILPVHAQMCLAESGVDPLVTDSAGFQRRCARRLKQNRTYVWIEKDELKFKADVISETPEAIYLEGIWIDPTIGGSGHALRCLSHIVATLLNRAQSICLLTNVGNRNAIRLYQKAGLSARALYESVFLEPRNSIVH